MSLRDQLCRCGAAMVARALDASVNLRRWAAHGLERRHFDELHLAVDLGHGLSCPLYMREAWSSFTETFVHRALHRLYEAVPVPDTWVDLGCHYGFFSLWVEQMRRQAGRAPSGGRALLADADARAVRAVQRMLTLNGLAPGWEAQHRAVGEGDAVTLFERPGMGSSLFAYPRAGGQPTRVPTLRDEDFLTRFPNGIDLLKIDVEGAELIFFQRHPAVLERVRFLALEWHSWAGGGNQGRRLVREAWEGLGFRHLATLEEPRTLLIDGQTFECGTEALSRD